ncbi:ThiF family adenylyltransferase [Peribacillus sp. NPDC046944]|uniref:ThiF family adenylyltransferase n=1 Tax=unclassified Peribacillus TaxID=2675266 RepID=UPI003D05E5D8
MDGLHNLKAIYASQRDIAINYLQEQYDARILVSENVDKYPVSLAIEIPLKTLTIGLIVNIPFNFPDTFPRVKLEEKTFKKIFPIPHLDNSQILCLFDDVEASPNPKNPQGLLDATINRAIEVVRNGISKKNNHDFIEEFDAYWLQESGNGIYISLVEPANDMKTVYLLSCELTPQKRRGIFADRKSKAITWIQNVGANYREEDIVEVLYVPLQKTVPYPFPKTNKDIYKLLKAEQSLDIERYFKYLDQSPRPSKVLFSIERNGEYMWGIWEHDELFKANTSMYKGRKRRQKSLKGFRKQTRNSKVELIRDFSNQEINKYYVEDIRSRRLKVRGGDGNLTNIDKKVAVIGCGSVGSHLVQGLFDIGIQQVLLIDPDTLSFENINRHVCGATNVGNKKAEALKKQLRGHYPTSKIHVCNEDVLKFLTLYPEGLNSYDLIISAISNTPVEQRLNELQLKDTITPPILNVWVEPYLAAGHALWVDSVNAININQLFYQGKYKYQVLRDSNQYTKRELGCSTSFVPYGVLELKKFITDVLLFICHQWEKDANNSVAFTWLGSLKEQRKNARYLEPRWAGANDFSTRIIALKNEEESG